jgi:hypothetical protein
MLIFNQQQPHIKKSWTQELKDTLVHKNDRFIRKYAKKA